MSVSGIMSKKIGPVPVLYIVAGFVAIFAVVAWRMKPSPASDTPADTPQTDPYDSLETNGTVVAPTVTVPERPKDNDAWIREGGQWLSSNKGVSPGLAYAALSKYVNGESRSITEQKWVDWVIEVKGYPPDPFVDSPVPTDNNGGGGIPTPPSSGGYVPDFTPKGGDPALPVLPPFVDVTPSTTPVGHKFKR